MYRNEYGLYGLYLDLIKIHYNKLYVLLDDAGVHHGQSFVIMALCFQDGISQKELAQKIKISPATITSMLQRMEKNGLIRKVKDIQDNRISRVYLTQQGHKIEKEIKKVLKKMNDICFSDFDEKDKEVFMTLLKKMYLNLCQSQ